jgi:glycosyltransferase involved in cell wall biosynthesis
MIDDSSLYSQKLLAQLRLQGVECIMYGPKRPIETKSQGIMELPDENHRKVWTPTRLPFQVFTNALRDKPDIVHFQFEFFGIHSYGPFFSSLCLPLALLLLRLTKTKTVVTMHMVIPRGRDLSLVRDTAPDSFRTPLVFLEAFLLLWYNLVSIGSHLIIVHAEAFARRLRTHHSIGMSKIIVIPHGVDLFYGKRQESQEVIQRNRETILYFGVLSPRKGLETLIDAYSLLAKKKPNSELLLVGATPPYYQSYLSSLKDFVDKAEARGNVKFVGEVSGKIAHELFSRATLAVLPYSYDISASGALSWASSHGLPVVASNTEYFCDQISSFKCGLVFTRGNPESLFQAMYVLLENEDLRTLMGAGSRKMATTNSWEAVSRITLECYKTLMRMPN